MLQIRSESDISSKRASSLGYRADVTLADMIEIPQHLIEEGMMTPSTEV